MSSPVKPSSKPTKPRAGKDGRSARLRILALFAAFVGGAAVLVVATSLLLPGPAPTVQGAAAVGGPFALVDQNGTITTEAALKGKPTLVFFGFTHCPDVCPTALFEMSEIFGALGPDANRLQGFFVSVDPERDTPEVLKSYLGSFAPQLRGLTGTPEQVDAMKKAYRVYSRKVPLTGDDYTMDHTAVVYLMDKTGTFAAPFNVKRPPAEAAAELKRYF